MKKRGPAVKYFFLVFQDMIQNSADTNFVLLGAQLLYQKI